MALACLVLPARQAAAQERGSISGTVVDGNRAPMRVTIVAKRSGTDTTRTAVSSEDGAFVLGGLLAGTYVITVESPGFVPYRSETVLAEGADVTLDIVLGYSLPDFVPVRDRWRMRFPIWNRYQPGVEGEYPFVPNRGADPYDQNVLKGDLPIAGTETFFVFTGILDVPLEYRSVPTPSGVSADRPGSEEFFGMPRQASGAVNAVASFELFHGSTAFKPRDWALRVTPQFQYNYAYTKERGLVDRSPGAGTTRARHHLALQEAFGEFKLADVSPNYDFVSVRAGIQPFTSDFRGFLFRDTNLGARLFGTLARNRVQWNLAYFDQLEKETNSELNLRHRRHQRVYIGNVYIQDFLTPGYTISPSVHINHDLDDEFVFDANGFLVRPSPIGSIAPHEVRATYVGLGGDGHLGRLNITHQFYQAFGTDELNGISGQETEINARFAALELSVDRDWYRIKAAAMFSSGDPDPDDDKAEGFDAIMENPNFAGGPFSFWNRQGIRLAQTEVGLVGRSTLLPALRSSKSEGQSNFVNPGLFLYSLGIDAEVTPKLRFTTTANYLQFHRVETLQRVLFQDQIRKAIGIDLGAGFQYRPWLNDNVLMTAGVSMLLPGQGFKDLLTSDRLATAFLTFTFVY
jgi:hypothetical protein